MIVRDLVTRLSFNLDRRNLDNFERSIIGFKTKIGIAASIIGVAVKKSYDFITNVAQGAVETKNIADYAGIALKDFIALRNVTSKLGLNPEQFNETFKQFSLGILEASKGTGNLLSIIRSLPNKIEIFGPNNQLRKTQDVILDILKSINTFSSESHKIKALTELFGDPEQARAWLDLIKLGDEEIKKRVDSELKFGIEAEKNLGTFRDFNKEVNAFGVAIGNISNTIGSIFAPVFTDFLKETTSKINFANEQITNFKTTPLAEEIKEFYKKPLEVLQRDFSFDRLGGIFEGKNQNTTTNNNNIEINVPAGTPENQVSYMIDQLKTVFNNFHDEKVREVINNNPVYEGR